MGMAHEVIDTAPYCDDPDQGQLYVRWANGATEYTTIPWDPEHDRVIAEPPVRERAQHWTPATERVSNALAALRRRPER